MMGVRTHRAMKFLTRNAGTGAVRLAQFVVNTGKSVATGIRDGAKEVEGIEVFQVPKPQATRKK